MSAGAVLKPKCAVPSCSNSVKYHGLCAAHYYERHAADRTRPALVSPSPAEGTAA